MEYVNIEDRLIVSSPGNGGLTYIERENQVVLCNKASTGIYLGGEGFFCGLQEDGGTRLVVSRNGTSAVVELSTSALDIHDVLFHHDLLYIVATQQNEVVCLDSSLNPINRWKLAGEEDSAHINSCAIYRGKLIASAFGEFTHHREYKNGTLGLGRVFDVVTGESIITGLSQPHSLTVHEDLLYLCSSEENLLKVYDGQKLITSVQVPGYARGVAIGESSIYVGLSLSRNASSDNSSLNSGAIAVIDKQSMKMIGLNTIGFREIYDIRIVKNYADIFRTYEAQQAEIKALLDNVNLTKQQLEVQEQKIKEYRGALESITNSKSWKITKPLRYVNSLFEKLK